MARRDGGGGATTRGKDKRDGRRRYNRRFSDSSIPSLLKRSARCFTLTLSSIVEKYNFPFEDDDIISIKSLTYDTPNGPKVWGEDSEDESSSGSHVASQNDSFSFEEQQSMNACEQSPSSTDYKSTSEITSIKQRLENTHLKEDIHLAPWSGLLENNKHKDEVDILVNDAAYPVNSPMILRTEPKTVHKKSSLQELMSESLHGHPAVVRRKQQQNRHPESMSLQLYNSTAEILENDTVICGNLYPRSTEKHVCSSFLETSESADEHCSWNNITIADMYPEMVKTLSRLMHKMYHKSSRSQIKRYGYGYWHPRKTKFDTAIERVKKVRPLKHNSGLVITKHSEKCKLPMEDSANNTPLEHGDNQMQCALLNEPSVTSLAYHNTDEMEMGSSGTEEDCSSIEGVGRNGTGTGIFPNRLSGGKSCHLESPSWIPSSSDHIRKGQPFEELSTICPDDPGATFDVIGDETGETSIMPFEASSHLNFPLNSNINHYLEAKSSPVKSPCRLFRNHEIKTFPTAGSLQRSQSFSQFLVNHNRIKVQQKSEDAFEKLYKELCCPQFSKPFKIPSTCTIPTKSDDKLLKSELCDWTELHQKHNKSGNVFLKSFSEGFPRIPTFLRAARLKKYEGMQVSETVNALVNSPVRTLPTFARSKRTAKFSNDFLSSPVKRLKNKSESFISRVYQKPPHWENINHDKSGMIFTLHSPDASNWSSNKLDSEFSLTSNHTFLVGSVTYEHESGIAEDYAYVPKLVQSHDFLPKREQNYSRGVSKKLSYNEGSTRGAYMKELCRDYQESFLDEMS